MPPIDAVRDVQYPDLHNEEMRGLEVTSLNDLYSRKEAADEIGKTDVTLKRWQLSEKMFGVGVGERQGEAYCIVYTQRMIDSAKAGVFPVEPLQEEVDSILTGAEAAELLDVPRHFVTNHMTSKPVLPFKKIGSAAVYIRKDVLEYKETQMRVTVENGRVGDYDLTEAITSYMQAEKLSQNKMSALFGVHRSYIQKLLRRESMTLAGEDFTHMKEVMDD